MNHLKISGERDGGGMQDGWRTAVSQRDTQQRKCALTAARVIKGPKISLSLMRYCESQDAAITIDKHAPGLERKGIHSIVVGKNDPGISRHAYTICSTFGGIRIIRERQVCTLGKEDFNFSVHIARINSGHHVH